MKTNEITEAGSLLQHPSTIPKQQISDVHRQAEIIAAVAQTLVTKSESKTSQF